MQTSAKNSPAVVTLLTAMTLLTVILFVWLAYRATLPMELGVNEPWNAYHVDRLRAGRPLYDSPKSLVADNYPPLSFYLVGAIVSATGCDAVPVGRWLSIFSTLALAGAIVAFVRQFGGSRAAAAVAAVWFVGTMCRFFHTYVGVNDPQLLAMVPMIWALAWFVRLYDRGRAVEPAILLMVAAGFVKHNLFAAPVTAIVWLALQGRRPASRDDTSCGPRRAPIAQALRATVAGGAAAALGLAICDAMYGENFFRQLLMPREYFILQSLAGVGRLQWISSGLVIFLIWACDQRRAEQNSETKIPHSGYSFSLTFAIVSAVFYFVQKYGAGVYDNAQFELTVAAAIGLGLAFERLDVVPIVRRFGIERGRAAVLLILIARLLIASNMSPYLFAFSPGFREDLRSRVAVTNAEVRRVAAVPGPVVCFVCETRHCKTDIWTREEIMWRAIAFPNGGAPKPGTLYTPVMTIARRAGKPFAFDNFAVDQRVKLGLLPLDELRRRLDAQSIRFIEVDPRTRCGR